MEIRPITADYRQALIDFAARIAERDRSFLDRTLISQTAVASWTQAVPERRLIAVEGDQVVGMVTVVPGVGWTSHVGDVRLVVEGVHRGRGVGRALAEQGLELARSLGLAKVMIEIMVTNTGGIAMFEALGFAEEARLRGQVRERSGEVQDLVLLSRWLDAGPDREPGSIG